MKKIILNLFIILTFTTTLKLSAQKTGTPVPLLDTYDTQMIALMNQYNIPGAQLAVTYKGKLVYNRGFGVANTTTNEPVYPNNLFRQASVSKVITLFTILYMVENGKLNLNDKVFGPTGILDDAIYQPTVYSDDRYKDITVRHLLDHKGGWDPNVYGDPCHSTYQIAQYMGVQAPASDVVTIQYALKSIPLNYAPGSTYCYSNFGYTILGRVIEKKSGKTYENYVRDTILYPLNICGMRRGLNHQLPMQVIGYDYPGALPVPSFYDGITPLPGPEGYNYEAMDAAGGWLASAEDLCKFLCAVDHYPTKPDFLSSATLDLMGFTISAEWGHGGSQPGVATLVYRKNNEVNYALLLNSRSANIPVLFAAMKSLAETSITTWPTHDLFTNTACNIPTAPASYFMSSSQTPCLGKAVQLTDLSLNAPTSFLWSITPATYNFTGGTTASSQNPQVIFNTAGSYTLTLKTTNATGTNTLTKPKFITPNITMAPFIENFESATFPPTGWRRENSNFVDGQIPWGNAGVKQWERKTTSGNGPSTASAAMNFYSYIGQMVSGGPNNVFKGSNDALISKPISLAGLTNPLLTFKVAYKYFDINNTDTLKIYISTDCGNSYSLPIYKKGGASLATQGSSSISFVPASSADWRTESINLTSFAGANIMVAFVTTNGYGNNLFIDDVNIFQNTAAVIEGLAENEFDIAIYPNPNNGIFNIEFPANANENISVDVFNSVGQVVYSLSAGEFKQNATKRINLRSQPNGIYFVIFKNDQFTRTKKIVLQ